MTEICGPAWAITLQPAVHRLAELDVTLKCGNAQCHLPFVLALGRTSPLWVHVASMYICSSYLQLLSQKVPESDCAKATQARAPRAQEEV